MNAHDLREACGYVQERKRTFVIPTIASVIMGLAALLIHLLCELFIGDKVATIIAIIVAVAVYGVVLVLMGGITEDEIRSIPKGDTILRILHKMHLIN